MKSKGLHEEGDVDWEERVVRVNVKLKSRESSYSNESNQLISKNILRKSPQQIRPPYYPKTTNIWGNISDFHGLWSNSNFFKGPDEDESIGGIQLKGNVWEALIVMKFWILQVGLLVAWEINNWLYTQSLLFLNWIMQLLQTMNWISLLSKLAISHEYLKLELSRVG